MMKYVSLHAALSSAKTLADEFSAEYNNLCVEEGQDVTGVFSWITRKGKLIHGMSMQEAATLTEELSLEEFLYLSHIITPTGCIADQTEEVHMNWRGYEDSMNRRSWQKLVFFRILSIFIRLVEANFGVDVMTTEARRLCIKYATVDKSGYFGLLRSTLLEGNVHPNAQTYMLRTLVGWYLEDTVSHEEDFYDYIALCRIAGNQQLLGYLQPIGYQRGNEMQMQFNAVAVSRQQNITPPYSPASPSRTTVGNITLPVSPRMEDRKSVV